MFSKQELQIISQTLLQRREWLAKQLSKPEQAPNKSQTNNSIEQLDVILSKILAFQQADSVGASGRANTSVINHYISAPSTSPTRQAALDRRVKLEAEDIRVLVVDDDQLICELVCAYLRAEGIVQIDTATDGMKGITKMFNAEPIYDLVLCDWNMPGKSGLDVHSAMRAAERYQYAIFMLVTAVAEAAQIRAAIEEGVNDYVVKPIEHEKLVKKILRFFPNLHATAAD